MTTLPISRLLDKTTPPHILTLTLLAGISALNMSIFLPSLDSMASYFGTDYGVMQYALSGYLAATAVAQLFVGPISDRYGRRPVVIVTTAAFLAATCGAMVSQTVEWFLFFRILQATIASAFVMSRAAIRDIYPTNESASMLAYVTMGMSIVPMVGPMVGGVLEITFGWQASFALLAVLGAGVLWLTYQDMGETAADGGMSLRDQVKTYPELARSIRFWGYVACTTFASGTYFSLLGGSSFVARSVFELSPVWAGVGLGAPAAGYFLGNWISGRYSKSVGINAMALYGTVVAAVGMGLSLALHLVGLSHPVLFFGLCTLLGLGNGMTMPNAVAGSMSVRPQLAGTASGLGGAIMISGGALLSAFGANMLSSGNSELPLQALMFATAMLSLASMIIVIRRDRTMSDDLPL